MKNKSTIAMADTLLSSEWIVEMKGADQPKKRAFCFHNAGGNINVFTPLRKFLPSDVSLSLIQLPGRDKRKNEPPISNQESLIFGAVQAIIRSLDLPYILFGYSGGAFTAFDVLQRLFKMQLPLPFHFIPHVAARNFLVSKKSKMIFESLNQAENLEQTKKFLKAVGLWFTPSSNDPLEVEKVYNNFRIDFLAGANSIEYHAEKVPVPITAIGNDRDFFTKEDLLDWKKYTTEEFNIIIKPGDHFEIIRSPETYAGIITEILANEPKQ